MVEETPLMEETKRMDIDVDANLKKGFSVPGFLRKLFNKELGGSCGCDHKLVVIAVHGVLLESGFVGLDTVSGMKTMGFHLPDVWPLSGYTILLSHTLPEIVQCGPRRVHQSLNHVETVVLKIQSLGKYIIFYGSLSGNGSRTYRVCLNKERLAFVFNLMWANYGSLVEAENRGPGSVCHLHPEKEVFEFWKMVKDELVLPLLIDLCHAANFPPPSCFDCLPTDIKIRVLELLPGVDLAKMACVSPELRFLATNNGMWKQKFVEQFGKFEVAEGSMDGAGYWKKNFGQKWLARKRKGVVIERPYLGWDPRVRCLFTRSPPWFSGENNGAGPIWERPFGRDPYFFRAPRSMGGRRGVWTNCNFGGPLA